jgi:predicted O-linked N-acetylglucosamine transferase (SPINDLY family)
MGLCQQRLGDAERAMQCWMECLKIQPDFIPALEVLVPILIERDADTAEREVRAGLARSPQQGGLYLMLGMVLEKRGQIEPALDALETAIAFEPGMIGAHVRRCELSNNRGMTERASAACAAFLVAAPDSGPAHYEAARAAMLRADYEAAIVHADRAAAIDGSDADALFVGGYACLQLLRQAEALARFAAAKLANPNHVRAAWAYAMAQVPAVYRSGDDPAVMIANLDRELAALDAWFDSARVGAGPDALGSVQAFYLAYQERDNRALLSRYGTLCQRLMQDWQDRHGLVPLPVRSEGPIRIAIVSHFISNHSVWHALTKGWLQQLDKQRFEVHLFALERNRDQETDTARSQAASLTQESLDLLGWCKAIQSKAVEAIIYPDIGMGPVSLMLAAMRLAPVQIASWGHPETTGLPSIDYYLSAEGLEPDDADHYYTEKLVRLPHLGCSYPSLGIRPSAAKLEAWGIARDRPVLLCPGVPFKYAPQNDHVLIDICKQLGRCQLVFFAHGPNNCNGQALQERLQQRFAEAGLNISDFVVTAPWLDRGAFYALMESSTLFLDTIGFSGFNTAMQAIESTLPVLTREGRFMRGRLASGILKRLGLFELITQNNQEYVERVVELVNHPAMIDAIKQRIRSERHVLFDDPQPVRGLEQFLLEATR